MVRQLAKVPVTAMGQYAALFGKVSDMKAFSVAMAAFLLGTGTANAEWTKVGSLPFQNQEDYYYDPSTITTANGRIYVWHLIDYVKEKHSGFGGSSVKFISSYRCGDYDAWVKLDARNRRNPYDMHQYKDLGFVVYSGRMGGGTIVRDTTKNVVESEVTDKSVGEFSPFLTGARAVSKLVCE